MIAKLTRLNIGIKIGSEIVFMIRFADNIVVMSESKEINEMLRTSENKRNSVKMKILVCGRDSRIIADV